MGTWASTLRCHRDKDIKYVKSLAKGRADWEEGPSTLTKRNLKNPKLGTRLVM